MGKIAIAVTLDPDQIAVVRQYAKDAGYDSTSRALRRIIVEWQMLKAQEGRDTARRLVDTQQPYEVH